MDVVVGVIERMKESKVAPILASMVPERAKTVTALLADRKSLATTGR
jgi:flagellar motility protein MotE (MotC chaperone)